MDTGRSVPHFKERAMHEFHIYSGTHPLWVLVDIEFRDPSTKPQEIRQEYVDLYNDEHFLVVKQALSKVDK